jgi:CHAD domain-containing protein
VIVPSLAADATVVDLVRHAVAHSVTQIVRHDPGARLGNDPEDVHKLRVAARRLRSDLRSFDTLLDADRVATVRNDLRWLGGVVGAVRDADVLAARLTGLFDGETPGLTVILQRLECEDAAARAVMRTSLSDARYLHLLDALVDLAARPPFRKKGKLAKRPPRRVAAKIARKPWQHLADAVAALGPHPADPQLHEIRILAKRTRYAAEAVAPLVGPEAARFAAAVAELQTVLGDHQDTVVAECWLRRTEPSSQAGRSTASEIIALERRRRIELRAQWPSVWKTASAKKLRSWF